MSDKVSANEYFGKARFQSEAEACERRMAHGAAGSKLVQWAASRVHRLAGEGLVFDLACGNGRNLPDLAREGGRVLGGDISMPMLRAAREITGHEGQPYPLFRIEAENLPFATDSIDVVFSARFFHHLPTREIREGILAEIFRVCRKGAVVTYKAPFTSEHLRFWFKNLWRGSKKRRHRYFFKESEFREIARSHGWRVTDRYSSRGSFSTNRVVVLEPEET